MKKDHFTGRDYIDGKLELFGQKWDEVPFAHREKIGRTVDYASGRNRYIGYLISLGMYSFKGMKVGLDVPTEVAPEHCRLCLMHWVPRLMMNRARRL